MSKTNWKARERQAAALIGGKRYTANQGGLVDCESDGICAQIKNVRVLSLAQEERLALEIERVANQRNKVGVLMIKRSAGRGVKTPWLVVQTAESWRALNGPLPTDAPGRDGGEA